MPSLTILSIIILYKLRKNQVSNGLWHEELEIVIKTASFGFFYVIINSCILTDSVVEAYCIGSSSSSYKRLFTVLSNHLPCLNFTDLESHALFLIIHVDNGVQLHLRSDTCTCTCTYAP